MTNQALLYAYKLACIRQYNAEQLYLRCPIKHPAHREAFEAWQRASNTVQNLYDRITERMTPDQPSALDALAAEIVRGDWAVKD